jgi:hypothetical protein
VAQFRYVCGNDSNKSKSDSRGDWSRVMLATIQSRTLTSSHLLSKNIKIGIHKTVILPVVLYGCDTWSVTLREEHRLSGLRTGC